MGYLRFDGVDAFEDVAQVAVAEVLAVGLGKRFALAEAAAGIGLEDEVAEVRERCRAEGPARAPTREHCRRRAAVDLHDERIFFGGVVILRQQEPALHAELVVSPTHGDGLAPGGLDAVVEVGKLDDAGETRTS